MKAIHNAEEQQEVGKWIDEFAKTIPLDISVRDCANRMAPLMDYLELNDHEREVFVAGTGFGVQIMRKGLTPEWLKRGLEDKPEKKKKH